MKSKTIIGMLALSLFFSSCYKTRKCQCYDAAGTPNTSESATTSDANLIKKIEDDCNAENSKRSLNNSGHCTLS